jgi:hypothetical protein
VLTQFFRKLAEYADIAANWFDRLDPQEQYLVMVAIAYGAVFIYGELRWRFRGSSYKQGLEDGRRMQKADAQAAFDEYLHKRETPKPDETQPDPKEE